MSEQRFTYKEFKDNDLFGFAEAYDNGKRISTNEMVDLLNEQQVLITALKEENEQLREINKELGDDLHNCRLNKNIIREKLKLWQDVHKEYGIYSINDFEELMKNDK